MGSGQSAGCKTSRGYSFEVESQALVITRPTFSRMSFWDYHFYCQGGTLQAFHWGKLDCPPTAQFEAQDFGAQVVKAQRQLAKKMVLEGQVMVEDRYAGLLNRLLAQ